ncbi:hypothetical protein ACM9HO_00605 [Pseudomonas sp. KHB2.9]
MLTIRTSFVKSVFALLLCLSLVVLSSYVFSTIIDDNVTITDARAYYFFYNLLVSEGVRDFSVLLARETGKMEIGIYLTVYAFFNSLVVDLQTFAFSCIFLVLSLLAVFVYCSARKIDAAPSHSLGLAILSVIIFSLWYPSYASVLWVWRSHIAFTLLFIGMLNRRLFFCILFVVVSVFFHYSSAILAIVVSAIFLFNSRFRTVSVGTKFFVSLLVGLGASLLVGFLKRTVATGDGVWESDTNAGVFVYIYVFIFMILLLYFFNQREIYKLDFSAEELVMLSRILCVVLFFLGLSATSINSHQDLMRIMQPAFVILPMAYLIFLNKSKGYIRLFLLAMLAPGVVMGIKSAYVYWGGV